jgi:hypothetical protein
LITFQPPSDALDDLSLSARPPQRVAILKERCQRLVNGAEVPNARESQSAREPKSLPESSEMKYSGGLQVLLAAAAPCHAALTWQNVKIGGGGGFVPGIIFHPTAPGVAYARTDIGGLYRLNADDSWAPITDGIADNANWGRWGIDAVALDAQDPNKVFAAVGTYTNSW